MTRRAHLLSLVLALALSGCGGGGNTQQRAAPDGSFAVGETSFVFVDTSRPTAPNNGVPGTDSRTLPINVYYPAAGALDLPVRFGAPPVSGRRFPLIIFAHGLGAVAKIYFTILQAWAAAGYVVVAPNFPLSNGATPGGAVGGDLINQPADESFVVDEILHLNDDPTSLLHDLIDARHIGASGQSLGGMTTFAIGFNTCCRDSRIGAAVPMAGEMVPFAGEAVAFPGGEYEGDIGPPVLIIHGDADDSVPYMSATEAYALADPPKLLLTHHGGGHILPYVGSNDPAAVAATIDASTAFFDLFLKHERGARERLLAVGTRERVTLTVDLGG